MGDSVEKNAVVSFHYTLKDKETGNVLETSKDSGQPITFMVGAGEIIPGLESSSGRRSLRTEKSRACAESSKRVFPERSSGKRFASSGTDTRGAHDPHDSGRFRREHGNR